MVFRFYAGLKNGLLGKGVKSIPWYIVIEPLIKSGK